ncbi:solute carrier organic anion transporter family member 3A1-like [Haliotis rubra]|uniref:solute carrier organic anion transporter family member 3A1-like n=1 Tax=Haliotis rubra TaxID=36100 RepID=UPI001EE5FE90|nr:solute carrier organic anion transporter family member 3A1-like [Haliotis rubra]
MGKNDMNMDTTVESGGRRCFHNILCFTAVFSVSSMVMESVKLYTVSQITALEKQFGLSSTRSGLLLSCNEIGYLVAIFFFSHFGGRRFIPRILSCASVVYGIASLIFGLLHFINPVSLPRLEDQASNYSSPQSARLCQDSVQEDEQCSDIKNQATDSSHWQFNVFAVLMVILGLAKSARSSLGLPYVDNNSRDKQQSSLLTGILMTMAFLGPFLALSLGGFFSDIPVDLSDMPRSVLRILKNPVAGSLMLGNVCLSFFVGGYVGFAPKYIETQFATSASRANFIMSILGLLWAVFGTLLGGILTSRLRLTNKGCMKLTTIVMFTGTALYCLTLVFGCDSQNIKGLGDSRSSMVNGTPCICDATEFMPLCGVDGVTYINPCIAGCQSQNYTITYTMEHIVCRPCRKKVKGYLPSPIVYGKVIDTTCTLWETTCGEVGACAVYDLPSLRYRVKGMDTGLSLLSSTVFLAAFLFLKYDVGKTNPDSDASPTQPEAAEDTEKPDVHVAQS